MKDDQKDQKSVNEDKNLGIPSGQLLKDNLSDAAPSPCPLEPKWCGIDEGLNEKRFDGRIFDKRDGCLLFEVPPEYRVQICRAVNAHDALVAALQKIYHDNEATCGCECDTENCCNRVGEPCAKCDSRAALALANTQETNTLASSGKSSPSR